jgi:hypothetical protein
MACWYASAQMVIQWRQNLTQSCEAAHPDPSNVPAAVATYKADNGLQFKDMIKFAGMLGLHPVPPQSPSPEAIYDWLYNYGPVWAAGQKVDGARKYGHVFVIAGIMGDQIYIHDPEPMNKGSKLVKNIDWLRELLETSTHPDFVMNFMHFPE